MFKLPDMLNLRNGLFLLLAIVGCGVIQSIGKKLPKLTTKWKYGYVEMGFLMLVFAYCMILLAAGTYNPFIYFRF